MVDGDMAMIAYVPWREVGLWFWELLAPGLPLLYGLLFWGGRAGLHLVTEHAIFVE